jgi:transposase
MIRLTDEQWERIRDHFPEEHIAEDSRFRSVRMRRSITKSACLVQLCFDFYMIEAKPKNLIGDRAYDSDPLDDELRRDGIEMIAPHRCNRRPAKC